MPIDVSQRRSPGWWMQRQFKLLADRKRQQRLEKLYAWKSSNPPLPEGCEAAREAYQAFLRQSRSNFAQLIVSAVSERMTPVGFRTAADGDETGDAEAAAVWQRAGMDVQSADLHDKMLALSEAYVIVGEVDEETGAPIITEEDPRTMVGEPDPAVPSRLRAALKVVHDDIDEVDRAYLYLAGEVWVAVRPAKHNTSPMLSFNPKAWNWDPDRGGDQGQKLLHDRMPVVRFDNKEGAGEFEQHLDLLMRINTQVLQRMVIATLQAFRQRAAIGLPLVYPAGHPKAGQEIDYSAVFTMDPAALWQLPQSTEMWESGQVDLTPILSAVKDDVQKLAAVTRTPMHMLMPAGQNQSAEGASMQREGLVFKCEDRITRTSPPWARVMSLAFLQLGQPDRADLAKLRTLWRSPHRLSLTERADASSKAQDIPWRSRMRYIWEFAPDDIDRMASERIDEQLLAAQLAAMLAAMQGTAQAPQPVPGLSPAPLPVSPLPALPAPDDVLGDPLAGLPTVEDIAGVR